MIITRDSEGFFKVGDICQDDIYGQYQVLSIYLDPLSNYEPVVMLIQDSGSFAYCKPNGCLNSDNYEFIKKINGVGIFNYTNQLGKVVRADFGNLSWEENHGFSAINVAFNSSNQIQPSLGQTQYIPNIYGSGYVPLPSTQDCSNSNASLSGTNNDALTKEIVCTCKSSDLLNYGCKCGYIKLLKS